MNLENIHTRADPTEPPPELVLSPARAAAERGSWPAVLGRGVLGLTALTLVLELSRDALALGDSQPIWLRACAAAVSLLLVAAACVLGIACVPSFTERVVLAFALSLPPFVFFTLLHLGWHWLLATGVVFAGWVLAMASWFWFLVAMIKISLVWRYNTGDVTARGRAEGASSHAHVPHPLTMPHATRCSPARARRGPVQNPPQHSVRRRRPRLVQPAVWRAPSPVPKRHRGARRLGQRGRTGSRRADRRWAGRPAGSAAIGHRVPSRAAREVPRRVHRGPIVAGRRAERRPRMERTRLATRVAGVYAPPAHVAEKS